MFLKAECVNEDAAELSESICDFEMSLFYLMLRKLHSYID
jgi:hypothetical protein